MLNKINTLLASTSVTVIKEFKTTPYTITTPSPSTTITLPAGITEGSIGFLLIGSTKQTNSNPIVLDTPTGFTLILKGERLNSGTGRSGTQGLFYKYMKASDSSTTISTIFADSLADSSQIVFVEVILNKSITSKGFGNYSDTGASAGTPVTNVLDVPSVIPNNSPFFLLTCATGSDGTPSGVLSGGMEAYSTSNSVITNSSNRVISTLWKYDSIKIQDLPDTADGLYTVTASGFASTGAYFIWFK